LKSWSLNLVEALRYKPEGRGFDFQWIYCDFLFTSGRTVALGFTLPLTEMSTRIFLGRGGGVNTSGYHLHVLS
jgi:hypothetical protein